MEFISQAEYARRLGVSRAAISQWKTEGRLVTQGTKVDVEASDAKLKRYRREGLPDIQPTTKTVKRGRPSVKHAEQLNTEPVRLTCDELVERLAGLDWTQTFDWAPAAQDERARLAAQCVGWHAVRSLMIDDGHWGGFQVRIPGYEGVTGPAAIDGVAAGHGFELDVWDVLKVCRDELEPIDDDDEFTVRLDLLPLLAHPFDENDKQR
jgi:transcriptional regulator with XRE-family HTH domain